MKSYLFYDLETSGLNPCFDQVLQFAAIRTDSDFNEIERHEIIVQLRPDVIPSPYASITHRISLERAQTGIPEVEAIQQIHALLNTPNTISLGYNTLKFDDEFLRFAFYRNLLPPYTHQYAQQCSRMDIYPLAIFYKLYQPQVIKHWPVVDGKNSLKLEHLNEANQWVQGQAHDAMVDVEATIALAKHFLHADRMWQYVSAYFEKKSEQQRLQQLPIAISLPDQQFSHGLLLDGKFGVVAKYQAPVLFLGEHYHYKNQQRWLRLDLPELRQTELSDIETHTWVLSKKPAEPGFLLPPAERFLSHISAKRQAIAAENIQWLTDNPDILFAIREHYLQYTYPAVPNVDIDAALYLRGFLDRDQTKLCQAFLQASLSNKISLLDDFHDADLREQALRIIGRNYPDLLDDAAKQHYLLHQAQSYMAAEESAIIDYQNKKRYTAIDALQDIDVLRQESLDEEQQALLNELQDYLNQQCEQQITPDNEEAYATYD